MNISVMSSCVVLVGAVAVWSCGSSGNPAGPSGGASAISIVGSSGTQAFTPNPAPFGGQQIVFRNNDSVVHRVTFNDGSADTGDIAPGATSRALAVPSTGTNYHCPIHPGMIGSINTASGAPAPPCQGAYCDPY